MNKIVYCNKIPNLSESYTVVIDSKKVTTDTDFLKCIWEQLRFPEKFKPNWDAYLDWMRDLSWIKEKSISIVVLNYPNKEPEWYKTFLEDLENIIFTFWKNDAKKIFKNKDMVKNISVFFVKEQEVVPECLSIEEAISNMQYTALGGQKTPHCLSIPVLRIHNNILYFASFVTFYNRKQLQAMMLKRPTSWIISDLKTGKKIQRYYCPENEFSNSSYEKFYNVSVEHTQLDKCSWDSLFSLLDIVRNEYIKNKNIRTDLYQIYLKWICHSVAKEYKVFYKDLSNLNINLNA